MNSQLEMTSGYQHKKFNKRKRSADDTLNNFVDDEKSISLPSSNCSDYSSSEYSYSTSTPIMKRRKLYCADDSGVSMTSTNSSSNSSSDMPAPVTAILPKISTDTLRSICTYHGNMVRKFPKKERTARDQERRDKNTIACRMSRRVKKLEHIAIEEQYKEFVQQHLDIVGESLRSAAYLNELLQLKSVKTEAIDKTPGESYKQLEYIPKNQDNKKKSFTIDYLIGNSS